MDKHVFGQFPGGRSPNSCLRCGFPPDHPYHIQLLDQAVGKADEALSRLARTELHMRVAELYAQRSSCLRGSVGAVIVKEGRIISTGYNGAPSGLPQCDEVGCEDLTLYDVDHEEPELVSTEVKLGCQRTIHAEANAIVWAARSGVPTLDCEMYSTHSPCATCARLVIAAGISKLYYRNEYRVATGLELLDRACVLTEQL
jgi:dCMP deaminase